MSDAKTAIEVMNENRQSGLELRKAFDTICYLLTENNATATFTVERDLEGQYRVYQNLTL